MVFCGYNFKSCGLNEAWWLGSLLNTQMVGMKRGEDLNPKTRVEVYASGSGFLQAHSFAYTRAHPLPS